jgi:RNA polymerase sigma-70 factor (ECF subfamily)
MDADSAQDICQKVFIGLWEKRADMDMNKSIKSYLFTAVKNRCLNHIRDHKKYRSQLLDVDCGDLEFVSEDTDRFAEKELQDKIERVLDSLPPKCRQVFELSRYQDMKYREIAVELDISQKTVEAHMTKAMKIFRQALKDYGWSVILFLSNDYLN